MYANKALSQRLERTEARSNADFVSTRMRMFPKSKSEWIDVNGTYAMFDGTESPLTQTFGLGLFNTLNDTDLESIESFYNRFSAPIIHEVSPMADPSHIEVLSKKGYQPIEMSNILYKQLSNEKSSQNITNLEITTRKSQKEDIKIWASINAKGWTAEMPGFTEFIQEFSQIGASCQGASPFFADFNGKPIATGLLYIYENTALLAGDSTILEGRNKGGQNALIDARLKYATDQGCSLAMFAATPGSQSQKNAEKNGFRIAYTRTKWKFCNT